VRHIRKLAGADPVGEPSDTELLHRFVVGREEPAFAALLRRHGPLVWSVCWQVLHHRQDAEDAFQATFLLLARQAGSIRETKAVASWLYRIAHRVATKAGQNMARRRIQERQTESRQVSRPEAEAAWRELQAVLNEELDRLPEKYRAPFLLCCLEGKSGPEAARQLGWKLGTVTGRLTEARKLLQRRLGRRGMLLSAVLASAAVSREGAAVASVALAEGTVKAALAFTTQSTIAGMVSAKAAALAEAMAREFLVSKLKVATALLLAAGVVAGTGVVAHQALADRSAAPASAAAGPPLKRPEQGAGKDAAAKAQQTAAKERAGDQTVVSGRVLNPDGKPVKGARLIFVHDALSGRVPQKVWATSAADGGFRFTLHKTPVDDFGWESPREHACVMAAAQGYGFAVARLGQAEAAALTLRLVKDDLPVRGRVLNLEGKPVAGVRVRINDLEPLNAAPLYTPKEGDLTAWLTALKANQQDPWDLERTHLTELYSPAFDLLFRPVTTGADGRFQLRGLGRERLAHLRLEGPTIATEVVNVMTRPGKAIRRPLSRRYPKGQTITYYGAALEIVATPTKPVVGVVRDRDTGKPLAGVTVEPNKITNPFQIANYNAGLIRTTTDKEGRYRLVGLPKGEDNRLLARTDDLPYLPASQTVENTPDLAPVTVDFALRRGIWVKGRVTEKTTGKPLSGGIGYFCFSDNPHKKEIPFVAGFGVGGATREDGTFQLVAVPGRGVIAVQVAHNDRYLPGVGAEKIKVPRSWMGDLECLDTYPFACQVWNYNALVEIAPKPGAGSITCDLIVDPGRKLTGTVLGPDGKPLAGARRYGWHAPLPAADFTVGGLKPNKPYKPQVLLFVHDRKKLAGFLVVHGDEKGPLRVHLAPWGTLTGRLLTPGGDPLTGVWVSLTDARPDVQPDKNGRFRIEGLIPGWKHQLYISKEGYSLDIIGGRHKDLTIKAGETRDLGELQVKPME
jgi:RNA polymerase sigma factor (sigma-70 family)